MTSRPRPGWGPKKPSKSMQIDFIHLVPFFSQNMYNVFLNESFWEWFCVLSWTWPARKLTWCHMCHCENISNKTFSFYYTCTWSFIIKQNKMGHFNLQQYKEVKSKMQNYLLTTATCNLVIIALIFNGSNLLDIKMNWLYLFWKQDKFC